MEKKLTKVILVIDDLEGELVIKNCLRSFCDVYTLATTEGLFEQLGITTPDLILVSNDIIANDTSVMDRLKEDERFAQIPAVALSKPFNEKDLKEIRKTHLMDKLPCVLAIDDAPDVLKSIYYELHNDYKVLTLTKPEMLEKVLLKEKPDLFLLDYHMPGLNGFDLIPIIREMEAHKKTPIIFLTSSRTMSRVKDAITLGACDYITKPCEPSVLKSKIAKHIKT